MFEYPVPPETSKNIPHTYQGYLILSWMLAKDIPKSTMSSDATLAYKGLQHVITDDDGCMIMENILIYHAAHLGGKLDDLQKMIYDLNKIPV